MRASQSCGNFNQRDPLFYDFPPFFSIYNIYGKGEKFKIAIVRVTKLIEAVKFSIFLFSHLCLRKHSSLHSFLIFYHNCRNNAVVAFVSIASRSFLSFFHFLLFSPILSIYRFSSLLLFSRLTRFSFLSFYIYLHIDMQLLYYDVVGKKREPDRLSVTDPKYNFIILIFYCEKHAFKYIIHIRWYCVTGNDKRIERKLRKTLIPLVSLSKYASAIYHVLLSRYEEIVIRHFDSASQILHIYLGNRSSNSIAAHEKTKRKILCFSVD